MRRYWLHVARGVSSSYFLPNQALRAVAVTTLVVYRVRLSSRVVKDTLRTVSISVLGETRRDPVEGAHCLRHSLCELVRCANDQRVMPYVCGFAWRILSLCDWWWSGTIAHLIREASGAHSEIIKGVDLSLGSRIATWVRYARGLKSDACCPEHANLVSVVGWGSPSFTSHHECKIRHNSTIILKSGRVKSSIQHVRMRVYLA
ncbi:hypothetical protein LR48_Vigan07g100700 [Vigna angularis]|uniref:Uncharacterized protein n=1 Tax=Phaseolus angularis TaxID=3914 RepID=A0A0L9UX10_PHAAN|nr:hypothetical protein LR48_Vigan07g100700 [Vigna angularis]